MNVNVSSITVCYVLITFSFHFTLLTSFDYWGKNNIPSGVCRSQHCLDASVGWRAISYRSSIFFHSFFSTAFAGPPHIQGANHRLPARTISCLQDWYDGLFVFSLFTNHVIKTKIVTILWTKSRIWDMIGDWYINNLAKNQGSAVFHSRVICRSVSPKVTELCMETPWSEATNMAAGRYPKHLSLSFAIETKNYCFRNFEIIASSSASVA